MKTTDWLLAGRGVQYNISDLELLDPGSAPDLYWWSETRVAKAYAAAGKPKVSQQCRVFIPISCELVNAISVYAPGPLAAQ